jgi:biopolymer transport protein ExbB
MLATGVDHLSAPRDLIEEVMYEGVLTTRLRLQRMLPFIAICAAAAPLLGLLGTVTGIINTFKLITVFGTGDVKTLSGGISEALITTEYGLMVAIPSLLLHAFLSRKARGVIDQMERAAVAFANQVSKVRQAQGDHPNRAASGAATPIHGDDKATPASASQPVWHHGEHHEWHD